MIMLQNLTPSSELSRRYNFVILKGIVIGLIFWAVVGGLIIRNIAETAELKICRLAQTMIAQVTISNLTRSAPPNPYVLNIAWL